MLCLFSSLKYASAITAIEQDILVSLQKQRQMHTLWRPLILILKIIISRTPPKCIKYNGGHLPTSNECTLKKIIIIP